jgi:hypothetical protein
MRGGRELVDEDFKKSEDNSKFKTESIDGKPHIFFGEEINDNLENRQFKFVIFNRERFGFGFKKSIGISVLEGENVKPIKNLENLSLELQYELSRLKELLKEEREYKTIREFLKEYNILQFINDRISVRDEGLEQNNKYSIYFYSIAYTKYNKYVLVFNYTEFIIISLKNDYDIISIERIFGEFFNYIYIYDLEKDTNVPNFIKEKLKELISKEKEIREQIIEEFRKNTNIDFRNLYKKLKKKFSISKSAFKRIFESSVSFIKKKIEKSKMAHMENNLNKTVNNVYNENNFNKNIYTKNNYEQFLEKGKILATNEKKRIIEEEEEGKIKKERNMKQQEEKRIRNNKLMKYKNITKKINQELLSYVKSPELNKEIEEFLEKSQINTENIDLIKNYVNKIKDFRNFTNTYLNENPSIVGDIIKYKNNNKRKQKIVDKISNALKEKIVLSNYKNDKVTNSILMRLQTKNIELKKMFIKPIIEHYVHEHINDLKKLTNNKIINLSNNNINKMIPNEVKNKLKHVNRDYIKYQLHKQIRKRIPINNE